ncbi:MAG TPA: 30S ribosomal protein S1 [Gemmataceae bacterium]|nr:30S ribosomal protein S1 [Gemmataceae bacterium]
MVNHNLLRQYDLSEGELREELNAAFGHEDAEWLPPEDQEFRDNRVVTGRVRNVTSAEVWVDVGYKSEGAIELREWYDESLDKVVPPNPGDRVEILLEMVEDETGAIILSYRKAQWQKQWEQVVGKHQVGDIVVGPVTRKVKGGLLVNIGVNVFLPASQVDIRRPSNLGDYIGKTIECKIVTINEVRRNIVVSRRQLIEDQRQEMRTKVLAEIEPGQIRKGVVKNITQFGAFVDLGGIDGLLHVTDMAWGRVTSPGEVVHIDQLLEVYIIKVDKEREKIALGLKQKTPSPWASVAEKYPVGSRHSGKVVNVMSYGAFVHLEPGVEGLVHVSEMSWTKRINDPSEIVSSGDQVEVQILNINQEKQEISLGMKQAQPNPWDKVAERYPPGTVLTGKVCNLTNYGAFVEIEEGIDGLLHVGDMSWVRKVGHPSEVVTKGGQATCVVLTVDPERRRVALGLKQMTSDPWDGDIPGRYHPGDLKRGKVTKLTNFGVFVELEPGLEGLLHISELADHKVESAEDLVKVGDEIEVMVLRVDASERRIGLSRKQVSRTEASDGEAAAEASPSAGPRRRELRGGTGSGTGQLFSLAGNAEAEEGSRE